MFKGSRSQLLLLTVRVVLIRAVYMCRVLAATVCSVTRHACQLTPLTVLVVLLPAVHGPVAQSAEHLKHPKKKNQ